jgi:predicted ABC-type ATPase
MRKKSAAKTIVIIAGPNGAGKTTLAEEFLQNEPGFPDFINADLIARGVSPLAPEKAAIQAGKIMVGEIRQRINSGKSFAFETTLAGLNYSRYIPQWQKEGYCVKLAFLKLSSANVAIERVKLRVLQGGHGVPDDVIARRFTAGIRNFEKVYRGLVDSWAIYDNSGDSPRFIAAGVKK